MSFNETQLPPGIEVSTSGCGCEQCTAWAQEAVGVSGSIPTQRDIHQLGVNEPLIYNCLMLHRRGEVTWEQCLMTMVVWQAKQAKALREMLEGIELSRPFSFTIPKSNLPQ